MWVADREIVGNRNPPPDDRLDVLQGDLELKQFLSRNGPPFQYADFFSHLTCLFFISGVREPQLGAI